MEPYDEPNIKGDDTIIRRINPVQHVIFDENTGCNRLSSKAFSPSSALNGGMSVDFLGLMEDGGVVAHEFVTTPVFTGSVAFSADAARNANMWVGYDPIKDDPNFPDNPFHGEIWGNPKPNRFTTAQKRALRQASEWFVEIPDVTINA